MMRTACTALEMPPDMTADLSAIADIVSDAQTWRRDLHAHPELMFDVERTAKFVGDHLQAFGCDEVVHGLGRTGVVGIINGQRGDGPTIGLRADMDALPIHEQTGAAYQSRSPGKMHACGHDGHTAMLLGAARHLARTRDFSGRVALIFQPAEEGGGGGKVMIDDGLMERFAIQCVYGLHNMPGMPVGSFAIRAGAMMAATDSISIRITGQGGHAASPHTTIDPVLIGAHIVAQAQGIVSRNVDPLASAVLSITMFHAGDANNVIPPQAQLSGTVRTFDAGVQQLIETRLRQLVQGIASAHGARAHLDYQRGYPVLRNHANETVHAARIAASLVGAAQVDTATAPIMAAEDFAYMLDARPGAFIFMGNGDSAGLHHPAYDFNDAALPYGIAYWIALAKANGAESVRVNA